MNIELGIKAPFADPRWLERTVIGALVSMVPILNFAAQGYMLDYTRAVAYDSNAPLPDWSNLGRYWMRGLYSGLAGIVLALPGIILMVLAFFPMVAGIVSGEEVVVAAGITMMCGLSAIAMLYFVIVSVLWGAAFTNYAMSEEISAFFDIGRIRDKVASNSGYFAAWGLSLLVYFVATSAGAMIMLPLQFIPFLGSMAGSLLMLFLTFCAQLISTHYYGQYAARAYQAELER